MKHYTFKFDFLFNGTTLSVSSKNSRARFGIRVVDLAPSELAAMLRFHTTQGLTPALALFREISAMSPGHDDRAFIEAAPALLQPPHARPGRPFALQSRIISVPHPRGARGWSSVCIPELLLPVFLDEAGGDPAALSAAMRSAARKVDASGLREAGQSFGSAVRAAALTELAAARARARVGSILKTNRGHVVTAEVTTREPAETPAKPRQSCFPAVLPTCSNPLI